MAIPASEATSLFTKAFIKTYVEMPKPTSFLRSFFPPQEYLTKFLSIEVMRGGEKIAVDVVRGSDGNRNTFGRSTEKVIEPPYYREFFDLTSLDLYDRLWANGGNIDGTTFGEIVKQVARKMQLLVFKIERAYELMCAQVLQTGIVTLQSGDNIDFKRKAGSMVDGSATTWATGTNNPFLDMEAGANFTRTYGKAQGGMYNIIFGSKAWNALLVNPFFKDRANFTKITLDAVAPPQRQATGGVLQGQLTIGSYSTYAWTYPEYYEDSAGVMQPYIVPENIIVIPERPQFEMGFAAVPQLLDPENPVPEVGAYVFDDYKDYRKKTHEYAVSSAGVPIPSAIDQIYTRKVVV